MIVPRSPLRIALWALAALFALFTLLLLVLTLVLPGWIAGRGMAAATEALGRPVSVEQARFEPWRLALVVDGLRIAGPAADRPPLLTLARGDAALSLRSLLRGRLVVESLTLTRPELRLARVAAGRYDVDDLLQRFAGKPSDPEAEGPEFAVYNIELLDGRLLFDDRPVQRKHELAALHLALPFVSTIETDVQVKLLPQLSGTLDGVAFDSRAEALPFEDEASARLSLKLAGLDLAPLGAYLPAGLPVRLAAGALDLDLALDFAERPRQPPSVRLSGSLQLNGLSLTQADGQPLLGLKRLVLPLADVQPLRRRLGLGRIVIDAPTAVLRAQPKSNSASGEAAAPPWQFSMAGLVLHDGQFSAPGLQLQAIQLKASAAEWPLKQPATLDASLRLGEGSISAQASMAGDALDAQLELDNLALERLSPWLPLPGGAKLAARVSTRLEMRVKNPLTEGAADRARLALRDLRLADARLSLAGQPLLTLAGAALDEAEVDLSGRALRLGTLRLNRPRAQLARDGEGRLNVAALMPPAATSSSAGPAWTARIAGLQVDAGALRWRDAAVPAGMKPVALAAEPLTLRLGALAWPAVSPVQAQLSTQLAALAANDQLLAASAGHLQWSGRIALAPLSASGSLQAQALPLHLLSAYLDPAWGLHLQRAELAAKAKFSLAQQEGGGLQTTLDGDLRLGPLALLQTRDVDGRRVIGEDLLSWQSLQLDGVRLALTPGAPPRLDVHEATLDDVYARLIVNEQGRFNLRDLGASAPEPAPASAAAASAPTAQPELSVGRIHVNRGLVDFSDRLIKPGYSARLTELQGSLGSFSSANPAMAPLTLRGRVAGTGLLEIDGQLKPGSPPAMDVQANVTDIELVPLSVYAGKYAGYAIERGKLSAKLNYKVEPGGQLVASNQIILNQLSFGDRVDSADATTLPVRFAVALLKDRNGVIDLNLPVSGSLSDPEFSVGGLVWKLFLNLVGKSLTSPFSLFAGGDADEQAQLVFAPASAALSSAEQLDRIARQLIDKPGVQLTLTGWADAETEVVAMREQRLTAALSAEQAATPDAALKRVYAATPLPNKPKNVLGLTQDLPPAQMRGLLLASYAVDEETLRQLAAARAVAVRDALLARGAPGSRLFLAAPKLCAGACEPGWRPHVQLSLDIH